MLRHCKDTILILLTVNPSCAPGSDVHPGHSVSCTLWNWAMWLSDPGKHCFRRFPEIITGCLKWAAEVQTIKHQVGTQVIVILSFELIYPHFIHLF